MHKTHNHKHDRVRFLGGLRGLLTSIAAHVKQNRRLIPIIIAVGYALSGIYNVPADQQAVCLRFGRLLPGRITPGLHYSFPYPVERILKLKVNEARRLSIGGDDLSRTLGVSNERTAEYLLSGDRNLVRIQAWIQYYIENPGEYLFRVEKLPSLLESIFLKSMTLEVSRTGVDEILTTGRVLLQTDVLKILQVECDKLELGVTITSVALEEVQPPEEVRDSFLDVANAREDRNRIVQEAIGYSNQLLPRVRGRAQQMRQDAEIYRTELVNRALGETDRFTQVWQEYRQHRDVTRARIFLEAIDEILPRMRKVILDENSSSQGLDMDILELQE